ncbi:multiple cyclophane-containing RiPP AmcA [Actinoplanes sp. NPDC051859]|uniref:multiple cyclophane-containing RiPP AmcA n=1 Tax=Actinoplanes sp. NPDC051859 TaxID=3363909 RepID=UPI0037BD521B
MPETTSPRPSDRTEPDPVTARVRESGPGLRALLDEAQAARHERAEADGSAVCAWNHFENIPTFYNWNNRPR